LKHYRFYILFLIISCAAVGVAQQFDAIQKGSFHQAIFTIRLDGDTSFVLPNQFIISGSENIQIDSFHLNSGTDYRLDNRFGKLLIYRNTIVSLLSDTANHILKVNYQSLPFNFKPIYKHREPVMRLDTVTGATIKIARPVTPFSFDDVFSSNLQKSGTIVRGFTIGSNRDLSLNSGFRMQMSGNLTNDIDIVAALTDENSPIQPEGTTQTLQEVDKVFMELRGSRFNATLGDFNLNLSGNEFGNLNRKLQGAKGSVNYQMSNVFGDVMLTGAVTRGKFITNQFQGLDGVQGPYRLTGENGNRIIIIVAGSERVYVNGEKMTRGENADFTIDYATAEVTFTPKRIVAHGSRIVVDFEYSDRQFNRNLIAAKSGVNLFNDRWHFNVMYVRENDNENSPIDATLSDSDKVILKAAGGDRLKASRSGVEIVGVGKGQYRLDSLIRIYQYAPEDTMNAIYSVFFTYVGLGNGNYKKISLGRYEFAGIRQGSYEPIRFLPMPQANTFTDFDLSGEIGDHLKLTSEYALVNFDPNRFSPLNDKYLNGSALKFAMQYSPKDIHLGGMNIGSFDVFIKERLLSKQFVALDRTNEVEFSRKWNVEDTTRGDEELREGLLTYQPIQTLTFGGGLGWIKRGEMFSSNRYNFFTKLTSEQLPQLDYIFEKIKSRNTSIDIDGNWIRQRGSIHHEIGIINSHLQITNEYLANRSASLDTLKPGSYRLNEIIPGLSIGKKENVSINADVGWRWDDSLAFGTLQRVSKTLTQSYNAQFKDWKTISSRLDVTIQNRKFSEIFKQRKNNNNETILLRWQTQADPFDRGVETEWFYEVATERTAKHERVFQRVPKGTGNYIYYGDVNGNHLFDQPDFQQTRFDGDYISFTVPTDELVPVIDLKASTRFRFNPQKIFSPTVWFNKAIATLSSETYYRVEEKSSESDKKQIYLLHFSRFLSDQTTISGSNLFTQDVYFLENTPEFSLRFRYTQHRGLTQFALVNERLYHRERSIRARWQMVEQVTNQTDYIHKVDKLGTTQSSSRARSIRSNELITDWSYHPEQSIEVGFKISVSRAQNFDTTTADMNDQSIRFVYSFEDRGQARAEFSREEVTLSHSGKLFPFELTNGMINGKTWLWRISLDYRLTQFIQASLNYGGRREGGRTPVHIGKAEVRAFF